MTKYALRNPNMSAIDIKIEQNETPQTPINEDYFKPYEHNMSYVN